ncbi:MAG TPA: nucleotide exchange factor GrpE [Nitrosopumilaceae archaeon]|nr:nucleotide exchange factor GrpE [Nitrosopumilaceae archaeon]
MSEEQNTETEVQVDSSNEDVKEPDTDELKPLLDNEKETVASYEKKLQYLLADFENLKKRTESEVQTRVNSMLIEIMMKFLSIYDDFVRAKDVLGKQHVNTDGLNGILKNMNSFLSEYGVTPIEVLGEIFDPKLHEAIAVKEDASLDDDTITKEIRKGYILHNRVIRPSLVEISKTKLEGEING